MNRNKKYIIGSKQVASAVCFLLLVVSLMSCSHGKGLWAKYERPEQILPDSET